MKMYRHHFIGRYLIVIDIRSSANPEYSCNEVRVHHPDVKSYRRYPIINLKADWDINNQDNDLPHDLIDLVNIEMRKIKLGAFQ